jgi:PIN domain nuclease of toxin-antitoxin system
MRYLLDTHTFLWFIEDSPNLPKSTKTVIEAADSDVYLSIASLWEIAIKVGMGKLQIPQPFETFISGQLLHNRIYVDGMTLISRDPMIDAYGVTRLW